MDVQRLADGLWRWTAPPGVGGVYYEAPDAVVLIDPLLPAGEEEEFLVYLDRDVERLGLPVSILLTAAWHRRSSPALRERYEADDRVPESVDAYRVIGAPEEQVAYFIRPHRTLVVAALAPWSTEIAELPVELVLVSNPARAPALAARGSSGR
jgi:hypothetical protein